MSSVPTTREAIEAELRDDEAFRQKVQQHEDQALDTLVRATKRKGKGKAPWMVSVSAAKTLIDLSRGKPATQVAAPPEKGGLHVSINVFTGSQQPVERVVPVTHETVEDAELVEEVSEKQQLEMGVEITRGKRK